MNVQLLARSLTVAGSAKAPSGEAGEEGTYLLEFSDGNLIEKLWVGGQVTSEIAITDDARNNTSASYIFPSGHGVRLVFFINKSNLIECYSYDEEIIPEWANTGLGAKANLSTGPQSKLGVIATAEGGFILVYQDAAGKFTAAEYYPANNEWTQLDLPEVQAAVGTPLLLKTISEKLQVFYVSQDNCLRYLVHDHQTGAWHDNILEAAKFDDPIDNFDVTVDPQTNTLKTAFLVGNSIWLLDGEKEKTLLGEMQPDGRINLKSKEQAGWGWPMPPYYPCLPCRPGPYPTRPMDPRPWRWW